MLTARSDGGAHLAEQGQDGFARVAANDGDVDVARVQPLGLGHKRVGAHHVQGGHAQDLGRGGSMAGLCSEFMRVMSWGLDEVQRRLQDPQRWNSLGGTVGTAGTGILLAPLRNAGHTLRGLYTPAFFSTSAQMGTVELTGLLRDTRGSGEWGGWGPHTPHERWLRPSASTAESSRCRSALTSSKCHAVVTLPSCHLMMLMTASGQLAATASHRLFTMPALMLKRSSRVMPGLRGTPAGMTTSSAPLRASASWSAPVKALTWGEAGYGSGVELGK